MKNVLATKSEDWFKGDLNFTEWFLQKFNAYPNEVYKTDPRKVELLHDAYYNGFVKGHYDGYLDGYSECQAESNH